MSNDNLVTDINQNYLEALSLVLSKMFGLDIIKEEHQTKQLQGGTVGDVWLVTGTAEAADGEQRPYRVVLKIQKRWERYGDPNSWRREYDLYASELDKEFTDTLRWPRCYHSEITKDEAILWMEYIEGISGLNLTVEMYARAAEELGRFQGRLYAKQPEVLQKLSNLSQKDFLKNYYLRYRSWDFVYDYIRQEDCELPKYICKMLIDFDDNSDAIFQRFERLPIVLCHRDFWVANIFYSESNIRLIDWDTTGWGYLGEDIASLIADEADVNYMLEYYQNCIPAYYRGFSEYVDISNLSEHCIRELILVMFGYRLIEWYRYAETQEDKLLHLNTLEKINEMGDINVGLQ